MSRSLPSRARSTPRLELRPFRRRDVDSLIAAVEDSLPELGLWLPWANGYYGRSDAIRFVRDSTAAWLEGRAHDFAIRAHDRSDHHVGNISVWPISRRERSGEIGYWIRSSEAGNGYATEAGARILTVGFEEMRLHRITLRIAVGNIQSERVAEKLGFVREGLLRQEVLVGGKWLDHSLWAMLEEDYPTERTRWIAEGWTDAGSRE